MPGCRFLPALPGPCITPEFLKRERKALGDVKPLTIEEDAAASANIHTTLSPRRSASASNQRKSRLSSKRS